MNIIEYIKQSKEINDKKRTFQVITGDLGKVIEEEDRLVCYVDKRVQKMKRIELYNTSSNRNKFCQIKKPLYYVFSFLDFDKSAEIIGYDNVDVIFENCNLGNNIVINGDCTINNCEIDSLWLGIYAKKLRVNNCNINCINSIKISTSKELYMNDVNINSKNDFIKLSSRIDSLFNDVYLKGNGILNIISPYIIFENSYFSSDIIRITSTDFNNVEVNASNVICNDKKIGNGDLIISNEVTPLSKERNNLVNVLNKVKSAAEKINAEEIKNSTNIINNKAIGRILKR